MNDVGALLGLFSGLEPPKDLGDPMGDPFGLAGQSTLLWSPEQSGQGDGGLVLVAEARAVVFAFEGGELPRGSLELRCPALLEFALDRGYLASRRDRRCTSSSTVRFW